MGVFVLPAFCVATLLLAVVTMLPLWRNPHWLIRGLDFPRLQFAVFSLLLLAAEWIWLDLEQVLPLVLLTVTACCLAWQLWWILPYTPLWPVEVKSASIDSPERCLSILTANILTPNRNAAALLALVRQRRPDLLVTLESDLWWQEQLDTLQAEMPFSLKCPLDNLYGMHMYSRLPIEDEEIEFLVEDDVPSMHVSVTLRDGQSVRMHFLHPAPPSPTENPESAERDAETVIVGRSVASCEEPVVVTGDLNDVAWSATTRLFRKISGLLDPRVGRGMYNTFHAEYPFVRWPLDHLFHSHHFTLRSIELLPSIGSDHFPLLTRLAFEPARGADQEGLEGDEDARARATSIASEQDVSERDVPRSGEPALCYGEPLPGQLLQPDRCLRCLG